MDWCCMTSSLRNPSPYGMDQIDIRLDNATQHQLVQIKTILRFELKTCVWSNGDGNSKVEYDSINYNEYRRPACRKNEIMTSGGTFLNKSNKVSSLNKLSLMWENSTLDSDDNVFIKQTIPDATAINRVKLLKKTSCNLPNGSHTTIGQSGTVK